ncbi:hypothetical protein [Sphingomonas sp. 2378]|uniref:hypothetical protein n=1 Tax=Sphingomonas sp. 2378 TaxID=1219748 RepID=UPI00311B2E55
MAWYRGGAVALTNGSATVTGTGTAWINNVQIGHAINLPDGRVYEVLSVDSNTLITLGSPYLGGTASGQAYSVQPNQGFAQTAATALTNFLTQVNQWVSGALAGRFNDGFLAAPGISFLVDQDTGIRRHADNGMALVTGGVDRVYVSSSGMAVPGNIDVSSGSFIASNVADTFQINGLPVAHYGLTFKAGAFAASPGVVLSGYGGVALATAGGERARIDFNGNFQVGTSVSTNYRVTVKVGSGGSSQVWQASDGRELAALLNFDKGQQGWGAAGALLYLGRHADTQRSLNLGGTLNAGGADYAEYMVKADGCGAIAKGDVCGVDADGRLTKTWANSISFVIKSTDPALVGGDTWDAEVGPKPEQPGTEPFEPVLPAPPAEDAHDEAVDAWRETMAAYPAQVASYQVARAEWQKATEAYTEALPVWEAAHEKARQCVDRIAFCGQVPCNVTGDFEVGDYIVAAASGAGIKAVAVKTDEITLPQYMRRIGKVWAIRDGRAWVDVQHG